MNKLTVSILKSSVVIRSKELPFLLLSFFFLPGQLCPAKGQSSVPYEALSDEQIDQLLSPIALYPDPLITQILEAATAPSQIVSADRYLKAGGDLGQVDQKSWDPSVKALTHYPSILRYLDDNLDWTTQVGEVFENQQQQEMDSIQRLRTEAYNLGNLKTTAQEEVTDSDNEIEIEPADSSTLYVPDYQSDQVYYSESPSDAPFTTFGNGYPIGLWLDSDFDWPRGDIRVWGSDYPRPSNWWHQSAAVRDLSHTTIRAANEPSKMVDRIDRGYGETHNDVYVQRPQSASRNPITYPEEKHDVSPRVPQAEAPRFVAPAVPEQHYEVEPRPALGAEPSGALMGSRSVQETHEFSSRGQQSMGSAGHASGGGARGGGGGGGGRR